MDRPAGIPIEALRMKILRIERGMTQREWAEFLETSQSIADIERGRIKLRGDIVEALARKLHINPSWLFGWSEKKYIDRSADVLPKVITTDEHGRENILLVPSHAYAGYPDNIHNPEWMRSLPSFSLPLDKYRDRTMRCFQIEGDSMQGVIEDGEYALTTAVEDIQSIKQGHPYIVVTTNSILCKFVFKKDDEPTLVLRSSNDEYPVIEIAFDDVQELWKVIGKICPDISTYLYQNRWHKILQKIERLEHLLPQKSPSKSTLSNENT